MTVFEGAGARLGGLPPAVRGMLWMALAGVLFTTMNTMMRALSFELHPWQTLCLRYAFGIVIVIPFVARAGIGAFRTANLKLQVLRNVVHTAGTALWFLALPLVPMAELTAIGFTGPIFMTIGAMLFLGERVRWQRWAAIGVGFLGVLVVLWPKLRLDADAGLGMLYMLAAAPIFAGSFLMAKVMTRHDRPEVLVAWQSLLVGLFSLPFALMHWGPLTWAQLGMFAICGVLGSAGHYALNRALAAGDVSATQPVKFLDLVWASFAGFVVWSDVPTLWTLAGATVIFAATLQLLRREAAPRPAAAPAPAKT